MLETRSHVLPGIRSKAAGTGMGLYAERRTSLYAVRTMDDALSPVWRFSIVVVVFNMLGDSHPGYPGSERRVRRANMANMLTVDKM